jgi:Leucine-rich repeat (LRR) protein
MLDLHPLELVPKLESLSVSHNLLSNLDDVINVLSLMRNLKNLDLRQNPITNTLRSFVKTILTLQYVLGYWNFKGQHF